MDAFTGSETFKAGDTFSVAGDTQKYAVTADLPLTTGAGTIAFTPAAKVAWADDAVITVEQIASKPTENLAFHRGAFALAMAPLSQLGNQLGAKVATAVDPITGLALRSTMWYEEATAEIHVRIDALWGVKTLNPDLACRLNST